MRLAVILAEHGVDLLDVSSYGNSPKQQILANGPGYQVPFSEAVKKVNGDKIFVGAVGAINNGPLAQSVLDEVRFPIPPVYTYLLC